jgi:hypothetical protein
MGGYFGAEAAGQGIFMQYQRTACFFTLCSTASLSQGSRLRKSMISKDNSGCLSAYSMPSVRPRPKVMMLAFSPCLHYVGFANFYQHIIIGHFAADAAVQVFVFKVNYRVRVVNGGQQQAFGISREGRINHFKPGVLVNQASLLCE